MRGTVLRGTTTAFKHFARGVLKLHVIDLDIGFGESNAELFRRKQVSPPEHVSWIFSILITNVSMQRPSSGRSLLSLSFPPT